MTKLRTRIIPVLLLHNEALVKTVRFSKFTYVGDPCNTVRIFNELEVDELLFLDITATREGRSPNLKVLVDIANECFMPLGYGGGIKTMADAKAVFNIGFEKVVLNSIAMDNPNLVREFADHYGSQSVIASIDAKKDWRGKYRVYRHASKNNSDIDPIEWAQELESQGVGEILLTFVDREGMWTGYDLQLLQGVTDAVSVPVIAHGGAGCIADLGLAVKKGGASAVAIGSMVVFQKKDMGVLVNFPEQSTIDAAVF